MSSSTFFIVVILSALYALVGAGLFAACCCRVSGSTGEEDNASLEASDYLVGLPITVLLWPLFVALGAGIIFYGMILKRRREKKEEKEGDHHRPRQQS